MGEVDSGQKAGLEGLNLDFLLQLLQAREALRLGGIHPREKVVSRWERQRARRQIRKPTQEPRRQIIRATLVRWGGTIWGL